MKDYLKLAEEWWNTTVGSTYKELSIAPKVLLDFATYLASLEKAEDGKCEHGEALYFMQAGRTIECGSCQPGKYNHCSTLKVRYGHDCDCMCHQKPPEQEVPKAVSQMSNALHALGGALPSQQNAEPTPTSQSTTREVEEYMENALPDLFRSFAPDMWDDEAFLSQLRVVIKTAMET